MRDIWIWERSLSIGLCMVWLLSLGCGPPGSDQLASARGEPQGLTGLPDLIVDAARLASSVELISMNFKPSDCAMIEGCVGKAGRRRLLRFDVSTPNVGTADMVLGPPSANPNLYEFSACHHHYHLSGYTDYILRSADVTAA